MRHDCISSDPPEVDRAHPPSSTSLTIRSGGSDLYGVMYHPGGRGPHPTMVIFHGFPGNEKNGDLAQIFRRAGFNTLLFSYRGAWGSGGAFSFRHVVEDSGAVLDFLRSDHAGTALAVDGDRIVAAGHSMGGFAAIKGGEERPFVKDIIFIAGWNVGGDGKRAASDPGAARMLRKLLDESAKPLSGAEGELLWDEILDGREEFDLLNSSPLLADRHVLLIGASRDEITPPRHHHEPFRDALVKRGGVAVKEALIDDGHGFSGSRIVLASKILDFLKDRGY